MTEREDDHIDIDRLINNLNHYYLRLPSELSATVEGLISSLDLLAAANADTFKLVAKSFSSSFDIVTSNCLRNGYINASTNNDEFSAQLILNRLISISANNYSSVSYVHDDCSRTSSSSLRDHVQNSYLAPFKRDENIYNVNKNSAALTGNLSRPLNRTYSLLSISSVPLQRITESLNEGKLPNSERDEHSLDVASLRTKKPKFVSNNYSRYNERTVNTLDKTRLAVTHNSSPRKYDKVKNDTVPVVRNNFRKRHSPRSRHRDNSSSDSQDESPSKQLKATSRHPPRNCNVNVSNKLEDPEKNVGKPNQKYIDSSDSEELFKLASKGKQAASQEARGRNKSIQDDSDDESMPVRRPDSRKHPSRDSVSSDLQMEQVSPGPSTCRGHSNNHDKRPTITEECSQFSFQSESETELPPKKGRATSSKSSYKDKSSKVNKNYDRVGPTQGRRSVSVDYSQQNENRSRNASRKRGNTRYSLSPPSHRRGTVKSIKKREESDLSDSEDESPIKPSSSKNAILRKPATKKDRVFPNSEIIFPISKELYRRNRSAAAKRGARKVPSDTSDSDCEPDRQSKSKSKIRRSRSALPASRSKSRNDRKKDCVSDDENPKLSKSKKPVKQNVKEPVPSSSKTNNKKVVNEKSPRHISGNKKGNKGSTLSGKVKTDNKPFTSKTSKTNKNTNIETSENPDASQSKFLSRLKQLESSILQGTPDPLDSNNSIASNQKSPGNKTSNQKVSVSKAQNVVTSNQKVTGTNAQNAKTSNQKSTGAKFKTNKMLNQKSTSAKSKNSKAQNQKLTVAKAQNGKIANKSAGTKAKNVNTSNENSPETKSSEKKKGKVNKKPVTSKKKDNSKAKKAGEEEDNAKGTIQNPVSSETEMNETDEVDKRNNEDLFISSGDESPFNSEPEMVSLSTCMNSIKRKLPRQVGTATPPFKMFISANCDMQSEISSSGTSSFFDVPMKIDDKNVVKRMAKANRPKDKAQTITAIKKLTRTPEALRKMMKVKKNTEERNTDSECSSFSSDD